MEYNETDELLGRDGILAKSCTTTHANQNRHVVVGSMLGQSPTRKTHWFEIYAEPHSFASVQVERSCRLWISSDLTSSHVSSPIDTTHRWYLAHSEQIPLQLLDCHLFGSAHDRKFQTIRNSVWLWWWVKKLTIAAVIKFDKPKF